VVNIIGYGKNKTTDEAGTASSMLIQDKSFEWLVLQIYKK
jgi:hypothetical protein